MALKEVSMGAQLPNANKRAAIRPKAHLMPLPSKFDHRITADPADPADPENASPKGGGPLAWLAQQFATATSSSEVERDGQFVRAQISKLGWYTRYFSPQIRGIQNLPKTGPVLVVGNHSCLYYMPDAWVESLAVLARRGFESKVYALGYDLLFAIPGIGDFLRKVGAIPAKGESAEAALQEGALVIVYPGGDWEASRPWKDRNQIDFNGRKGFIRLALKAGVPIVPVVSHGAHDAIVIASRGGKLAKAIGLNMLRIKVFPLLVGPPFGINPLLVPLLPMPSAITVEFLPAITWNEALPEDSNDDQLVAQCYEEVTTAMQAALTRLHDEYRHPVARGFSRLFTGQSMSDPVFRQSLEAAKSK